MTELILGTAQFGAGYGITNSTGRLSDHTVVEILDVAAKSGIDLFDTAPDYGDAQHRLGAFQPPNVQPRYVSKFGIPSGRLDASALLDDSLAALNVKSLYGMMFHRVADLRDARAPIAWDALRTAQSEGRVSRIGASIYDSSDLAIVVDSFPDLDLIQIPGNILDRRLLDSPSLRELSDRGVEIHVRSAYLQGLLLAAPEDVPDELSELRGPIRSVRATAIEAGLSVLELSLGFLKHHELVDAVLVGALAPIELQATVAAWAAEDAGIPRHLAGLHPFDERLLDPRNWPPRSSS